MPDSDDGTLAVRMILTEFFWRGGVQPRLQPQEIFRIPHVHRVVHGQRAVRSFDERVDVRLPVELYVFIYCQTGNRKC